MNSRGKKSQVSNRIFLPFFSSTGRIGSNFPSLYNSIDSVMLCKSSAGRWKMSQCDSLSWCRAKRRRWIILLTLCIESLFGQIPSGLVASNFDWVHLCSKLPKSTFHQCEPHRNVWVSAWHRSKCEILKMHLQSNQSRKATCRCKEAEQRKKSNKS